MDNIHEEVERDYIEFRKEMGEEWHRKSEMTSHSLPTYQTTS